MEIIYNKLVRDKIPEIIRQHGKTPVVRRVADQDELGHLLVAKLEEEDLVTMSGETLIPWSF